MNPNRDREPQCPLPARNQSPRPLPLRTGRDEMPLPGHPITRPHRARQGTMGDALEASTERVLDHLRRPIPGRGDLLTDDAGNTVSEIDPPGEHAKSEGSPNPGSPTEHVTKGITSAVKAVWSPQQQARNRQEGWTILWTSLSGGPGWSAAGRVSRLIGVGIVIQEPAGRGSPSVPYR